MARPRMVRSVGHITRTREKANMYRVSVGKPEGKRILARPRRKWENNIKMDLRGIGWGDIDWIHLSQNRNQSC
jgi:hypothetical protein